MYSRNQGTGGGGGGGTNSNRSSASNRKYMGGERGSTSNRNYASGGYEDPEAGLYSNSRSNYAPNNSNGGGYGGNAFNVSTTNNSQSNYQREDRSGGGGGGGNNNGFTDVYDPDFISIIHVPTHRVFHRPSLQMGVNRLVLCRNNATSTEGLVDNTAALEAFEAHQYEMELNDEQAASAGNYNSVSSYHHHHSQPPIIYNSPTQLCNKGHHCKFVHADIVGCKRQSVHVSYALRTPPDSKYQRAVSQVIQSLVQGSGVYEKDDREGGVFRDAAPKEGKNGRNAGNEGDLYTASTPATPSVLTPKAFSMFRALTPSQQASLVERTRVYVTAPNNRAPATEVLVATVLATKGSQQLMPIVVRDIERWAAMGGGAVPPLNYISGILDQVSDSNIPTSEPSSANNRRGSDGGLNTTNSSAPFTAKAQDQLINGEDDEGHKLHSDTAAAVESLLTFDTNNDTAGTTTVSNGSFEVTSGKVTSGALSRSISENNTNNVNQNAIINDGGIYPPLRSTSVVNNPNGISTPTQCLSHCAHYYFNRLCNRGNKCHFIHSLFIDSRASIDSQQRAPAPHSIGISPELEERKRRQMQSQGEVPNGIGGWTSGNASLAGVPLTVTVGANGPQLSHQPLSVVVGSLPNSASRTHSRSSSVQQMDGLLSAYALEQQGGANASSFTVTSNTNNVLQHVNPNAMSGAVGKSPGRAGVASSVSSSHGITAAGGSVRTASSSQPQNISNNPLVMLDQPQFGSAARSAAPPAASGGHVLSPKAAPFVFGGNPANASSQLTSPSTDNLTAGNAFGAPQGVGGAEVNMSNQNTPLNMSPIPQQPAQVPPSTDPLLTYLATLLSAVLHNNNNNNGGTSAANSAIPSAMNANAPSFDSMSAGGSNIPLQTSAEPRQVWVTDYEGNPIPCWVGNPPTSQMRLLAQQQQLQYLLMKQNQLFNANGSNLGGVQQQAGGGGGGGNLLGEFIHNNNIHQSAAQAAAAGGGLYGANVPTNGSLASETTSRSDGLTANSPIVGYLQQQYSGYPASEGTPFGSGNYVIGGGGSFQQNQAPGVFQHQDDDGEVFVIPTPNARNLGGGNGANTSAPGSGGGIRRASSSSNSSPSRQTSTKEATRGPELSKENVRDLLLSLSAADTNHNSQGPNGSSSAQNLSHRYEASKDEAPAKKSGFGVIGGKKFAGANAKSNPMSPFADGKSKSNGYFQSPTSTQTSSPSDAGGSGLEGVIGGSSVKSGRLESTISRGSPPRGSPVTSLTSREDGGRFSRNTFPTTTSTNSRGGSKKGEPFKDEYVRQPPTSPKFSQKGKAVSGQKEREEPKSNAKKVIPLSEDGKKDFKASSSAKGINIQANPYVASSSSSNFCSPLFDANSNVTSPVQQQPSNNGNTISATANGNGGRGGRGGGGNGSGSGKQHAQPAMFGSGSSVDTSPPPAFVNELLSSVETPQ